MVRDDYMDGLEYYYGDLVLAVKDYKHKKAIKIARLVISILILVSYCVICCVA